MRNLFKKKIEPKCEYCAIGNKTKNNTIICIKYGINKPNHHCKNFKYDPLKRIPKKTIKLSNFEKKDFEI